MRSTIHPTMPVLRDAYALAPDRDVVLQTDAIVARFVEAPKPLVCGAVASSRGIVVISLEPPKTGWLRQLGFAATLERLEWTIRNSSQSLGTAIESVARNAGVPADGIGVLCVGRDEMRLFSSRVVTRWERDYGVVGGGYALGSADEPGGADERRFHEARRQGAACILRLGGLAGPAT